MSILIKMEMPKNCVECKLWTVTPIGEYGAVSICKFNGEKIAPHGRRKDCPLIEVLSEDENEAYIKNLEDAFKDLMKQLEDAEEVDFFEDLTKWQKFVCDVKARVSIFFHNLKRK